MRDSSIDPYSPDEMRVCAYIRKMTNDTVGCGDDPIGFLIGVHGLSRAQIQKCRELLTVAGHASTESNLRAIVKTALEVLT